MYQAMQAEQDRYDAQWGAVGDAFSLGL